MDPTITHQPADATLDALIVGYVQALERGEAPDQARLLADHPQQAEGLRAFFADDARVHRLTSRATSPLPAQSILGSYRIVREVGRGGMGIVYEAIHESLKKQVALKLLPVSPLTGSAQLERFLREAQTAASLHHTNIVPVFDVGQVDGIPFYAMQFIEGETLTFALGERCKPPPGKNRYMHLAHLGQQAASALAYAHHRGVIHRDIKPGNLLLDGNGTLWITDFGLAKRFAANETEAHLTHSGMVLGTPRYMSPEQASASKMPIDQRTDIYSLGVTLYELLAGQPAFDGTTPPEVVQQILTRDAIPLCRHDPLVPRDLETVVMKAMAKQPQDRYATAEELANDLNRFMSGQPVQARRIGILGSTWRWAKREPKVAMLIGAVLGSLFLGMIGTGWYANQTSMAKAAVDEKSKEYAKTIGFAAAYCGTEMAKGTEDFRYLTWFTEPLTLDIEEQAKQVYRRRVALYLRYHTRGGVAERLDLPQDLSLIRGKLAVYSDLRIQDPHTPKSFEPIFMLADDDMMAQLYDRENHVALSIGTDSFKVTEVTELREVNRRVLLTGSGMPVSPPLWTHYSYWPGVNASSVISTNNYIKDDYLYHVADRRVIAVYNYRPFNLPDAALIEFANLLACHRLARGRNIPLTSHEARAGWQSLQAKYPDVFTIPIDECLTWHLKEDADSVIKKHQHAALFAANCDCRDRANEPHPFVARARLFMAFGKLEQANNDFAAAWKLGGIDWVECECRRIARDAWKWLDEQPLNSNAPSAKGEAVQILARLEIAAHYSEQDSRTMSALLLGKPPLHRLAIACMKQHLGIDWDERDRQTMWMMRP